MSFFRHFTIQANYGLGDAVRTARAGWLLPVPPVVTWRFFQCQRCHIGLISSDGHRACLLVVQKWLPHKSLRLRWRRNNNMLQLQFMLTSRLNERTNHMSHKFGVGQAVEYKPTGSEVGLFTVIRQMPEDTTHSITNIASRANMKALSGMCSSAT